MTHTLESRLVAMLEVVLMEDFVVVVDQVHKLDKYFVLQ